MTAHRAEKLARVSTLKLLDAATTQAVYELQTALRIVRRIERDGARRMAPAQQRDHQQRLAVANSKLSAARLGLERLLEEDA